MLSFTHNLIDFSATTATIFPILTVLPFVRCLLRQDSWGLWVGLSCMYLCMFAHVWALLLKLISPSQSNIILKITTKQVRFWQLNRLDLHYSFPSRQCCCCPEHFVSRVYRVCVCVGGVTKAMLPECSREPGLQHGSSSLGRSWPGVFSPTASKKHFCPLRHTV